MNSTAIVGILFNHTVDSRPFLPLEEYLLVVCCKWIPSGKRKQKTMENHYV